MSDDTKDGKVAALAESESEEEEEAASESDKQSKSGNNHVTAVTTAQQSSRLPPEVAPGYRDYSTNRPVFAATGSGFQSFPQKLHAILSKPEYNHICSWLPHGRAWIVHNTKDFEQVVLPRYFR